METHLLANPYHGLCCDNWEQVLRISFDSDGLALNSATPHYKKNNDDEAAKKFAFVLSPLSRGGRGICLEYMRILEACLHLMNRAEPSRTKNTQST